MRTYARTAGDGAAEALSVAQVAQRLGVHANTVRTLIHSGALPALRLGPARSRQLRVLARDLEDFIAAHRVSEGDDE